MFTPGTISFQVIIPGSPVFKFNCDPVGLTSAVPVTVTLPVDKVNAFPVTGIVISVIAIAVPTLIEVALPVTERLASAVIVTVPAPKVNLFGVAISTIESAVIPTYLY